MVGGLVDAVKAAAPILALDLGEQAAAFALGDPDPKCSILIKFQVC